MTTSKTIKSQGQKRKKYVQVFSILFFLITTYYGASVVKLFADSENSWIDEHNEAVATIVDKRTFEEEYSGRKGRTKYRTAYEISYTFTLNDEPYSNSVVVSESTFNELQKDAQVKVWYNTDDPYYNDTADNAQSAIEDNNIGSNMVSAAPFTGGVSYFIYWMLSLLFVRESRKKLPEGFYTENSWLDVDDKFLVAMNENKIDYFSIRSSTLATVQQNYQRGDTIEQLSKVSESKEFFEIPFADIIKVESAHTSDTIKISTAEDEHSIEFLNQAVKAHALERMEKHFPTALLKSVNEPTRLKALIPSLIMLSIVVGLVVYLNGFLIKLGIGLLGAYFLLPSFVRTLIEPAITTKWDLPEVEAQTAS
jgi:hypothetical protein